MNGDFIGAWWKRLWTEAEAQSFKNRLGPRARTEFLAEDRRLTLQNVRVIALLAAVLVPFFSILDFFAYPEHFRAFLILRLLCTITVLVILRVSESPLGKRWYRLFVILVPLVCASFISLMIYWSRDPNSAYYAGLMLCLTALGFVFHWTYREALIASAITFLLFLGATLPPLLRGVDGRELSTFANNAIFLLGTAVVIVSGCFFHHRIRVREFATRHQLRLQRQQLSLQNEQLEETLRELKETEHQLIQSEKMASLGTLSAGIIHEIGNPLNFANQALFLLRKRLKKQPQIVPSVYEEILKDALEGIDRIKEIVTDLREVTHKGGHEPTPTSATDCVHSTLRMLAREITHENILVEVDVPEDLQILAVKNQFTQVLINLVQNAIHATGNPDDRDAVRRIEISAQAAGSMAKIHITDNGKGISEENLDQIFTPFFTTKSVGQGTGLGLSICYRIVEAHGGSLSATSEVGHFTRFTITMPLVASHLLIQEPVSHAAIPA